MTDPLGQSQVLPYIVGLSKHGYKFCLVSVEKRDRYKEMGDEIQAICKRAGIRWQPLFYTKKPPILSTLWDLYKMNSLIKKLHSSEQFSVLHCRSYIPSLIALSFKRKYGIPFIFDMRGFWADERIEGGIWNLKNPVFRVIYNYFKHKEEDFFKNTDYIVSLTLNAKEYIEHDLKIKTSVEVIPCCVDLELFKPSDIQGSNNDPKRMVYLGTLGSWYMLDEMLLFYKELLLFYPNVEFLFISREPAEMIFKRAAELGVKGGNIKLVSASRQEVPDLLKTCDFSIFFIRPTFSKKASSPTKQGELMGMGIPVICNSGVGDTDYVVKKYKSGVVIDELTLENYTNTIKKLDELFNLDPKAIRAGAESFYALQKGIDKYRKIYQTVLGE